MKKLKKGLALLLAASLSASFPVHVAKANFCSGGSHDLNLVDVRESVTTWHRVWRNQYVGREQVFSVCNVAYKQSYTKAQCSQCDYYTPVTSIYRYDERHSLGNDPDHNNGPTPLPKNL